MFRVRYSYVMLLGGIMAFIFLLSLSVTADAAVPDWVKQVGIYVEIKDSLDRGEDGVLRKEIKGYLLNYDVSCRCVTVYLKDYNDWVETIEYQHYRKVDEFLDMTGVASLIFADDGKVYITGLDFLNQNNRSYEFSYMYKGDYDLSSNILKFKVPFFHKFCNFCNMLYSEDEGVEVRKDVSADSIQFRIEPGGDIKYIAPDRVDNAIPSFGLHLIEEQWDEYYEHVGYMLR